MNKVTRIRSSLVAALVVTGIPGVAQASEALSAGSLGGFWAWLMSLLYGGSTGGNGSGGSSVPELGGEGLAAVAVILLCGVALLMDRLRSSGARRRARARA
jgi:hypothetical protein